MDSNISSIIPVILSNLEKAAEKQQNYDDAEYYGRLAKKHHKPAGGGTIAGLKDAITADISLIDEANKLAVEKNDRGAQRALKWGAKVATIQKSLVDRYMSKGEALLDGKSLYLCEACGFIFLGDAVPAVCPVCKAPSSRFSKVGG